MEIRKFATFNKYDLALLSSLYRVTKTNGGNIEKRRRLEHMRAPWVPAPAKSSTANFASLSESSRLLPVESTRFYDEIRARSTSSSPENIQSSEIRMLSAKGAEIMTSVRPDLATHISRSRTNASKKVHRLSKTKLPHLTSTPTKSLRKSGSQIKRTKFAVNRRPGKQYALKSKDSLVDVTACLQEKREEVMKLWEKSLVKGDPNMLVKLETANRLALEAAEEVEKLRRTIQDFQTKDEGLSDSDCGLLEQMRINVLEKVKLFEEADNLLQDHIARQSTSKTSILSGTSKTSQTELNAREFIPAGHQSESSTSVPHFSTESLPYPLPHKSHSSHELIQGQSDILVLKDRPDVFLEESECEGETALRNEMQSAPPQIPFHGESSKGHSGISSQENLARLRALFEEAISLSDLPGQVPAPAPSANVSLKSMTFIENGQTYTNNIQMRPKLTNRVRFEGDSKSGTFSESAEGLYREKISTLQRHLMETENEVEELKSEVERIESDASFRVRILQNHVHDKFETLKMIPEYLELIDLKLKETVEDRGRLQHALEMKDVLLKEMKEQIKNLKDENLALREQVRSAENGKEFVSFKNTELEKQNVALKKQVDELTNQVGNLTCEVKTLRETQRQSRPKRDHSLENHRLKLECEDLSEQLVQVKKLNVSLKRSKSKVTASLNERIEELMQALQQAQHHKRILGDQIRYLKKSYNDLFPDEMFNCQSATFKVSAPNIKKRQEKQKDKPCEEPLVQSEHAWRTGSGIKLDDLLKLPVNTD